MQLTFDQIHVILDALTQHADRINNGVYDPTKIYEGATAVFPDHHPLRNLAEYLTLTNSTVNTFDDVLGAAAENSAITITIEG